jgi:hypothetical protein
MSVISCPAKMAGYLKRIQPLTESSTGPVKISPSGKLTLPEHSMNLRSLI